MAKTGFWLRGGSAGISTLNSQYLNNAGQGSVLQSGSSHTDPADPTDNSGSNSGSGNSENSGLSPAECGVAICHFCGTIIKQMKINRELFCILLTYSYLRRRKLLFTIIIN